MKKAGVVVLIVILIFNILFLIFFKPKSVAQNEMKNFTAEELKKYDGTDENMPIYMAYDGNVYDVTGGREYYRIGGSYHDLAGKDSTAQLNIAGGGIIKFKYKIIGKLVP